MGQSLKIEQPYKLTRYRVGSPLPMDPLDKSKIIYTFIPGEIILIIAEYCDYFNITVLKQACRHFFVIISPKWPTTQYSIAYWENNEIQYSRKQYSYNLCMKLYKKRVTHNGNNVTNNLNMDPVCYFDGIINRPSPSPNKVNPSQWKAIRLKSETSDYIINQSWVDYLKVCEELNYLRLENVDNINLNIENLSNLKEFFMEFKSIHALGGQATLPSSVEEIVVHASEGNYQERYTLYSGECFSNQSIKNLHLRTLKGTLLGFL
jgi:hypothetical protein